MDRPPEVDSAGPAYLRGEARTRRWSPPGCRWTFCRSWLDRAPGTSPLHPVVAFRLLSLLAFGLGVVEHPYPWSFHATSPAWSPEGSPDLMCLARE